MPVQVKLHIASGGTLLQPFVSINGVLGYTWALTVLAILRRFLRLAGPLYLTGNQVVLVTTERLFVRQVHLVSHSLNGESCQRFRALKSGVLYNLT